MIVVPDWKLSIRQNFSLKKVKDKLPEFYKSNELKIEGKNFIDLAKQTYRPEFVKKRNYSIEDPIEEDKIESPMTDKIINKYHKVQAPDFKNQISREKLNLIYSDKGGIIPFSMPKYTLVRESFFK